MVQSRARRIPIVDQDDETQRSMVVSVITQYRILKFVAVNVGEIQMLGKTLKDINVGTYGRENIATASMDTPVIEVIHMLVKKSISSVPILDAEGKRKRDLGVEHVLINLSDNVINVFEAVDVIALIKGGHYDDLNMSVGEALLKRPDVSLHREFCSSSS